MRDLEEMKLARVIEACGGIKGRVKMQKIVYLLQAMGYDLPYDDDFAIRQYGPYSSAVACDTDVLQAGGVIKEEPKDLAAQKLGEPVTQYSYAVREAMRDLVREHFDVVGPNGKPAIDVVGEFLNKQPRPVLEVAATKVFLERNENLSGEALETELRKLKGHLVSKFSEADALIGGLREKGWLMPFEADGDGEYR